jgi:hypothetical protein
MRGDASIYGAMVIAMLIVIASSMMFNYLVSLKNFQNEQASMLSQIASKINANVWFTPNGSSIILYPDRYMGVMSIMIYDSNRVYYMNTGSSPIAYASLSNPLNLSTIVPQTYIQMVMQGNTYLAVLMDNGVLYTYRYNSLGSGSDGTSATYYLDAIAGYYYVIMTGKNLTAYYIDSNGNRVSIPTYRWDINPNWVIFQAPATTRIYLTVTNTPLSTFNTPSNWFTPDSSLSAPYYTVIIIYPSLWSQTHAFTVSPFTRQDRVVRTFDGATIFVIYTVTYVATSTNYIDSAGASTGSTYDGSHTATIIVQAASNAPDASVYANPFGYYFDYPYSMWTSPNTWYHSCPYFNSAVYSLRYWSSSGSGLSVSISVRIDAQIIGVISFRCFGGQNMYAVNLTITPSANVSYSSFSVYSQVDRIITTDTGARIYVVGSLDSLPTA